MTTNHHEYKNLDDTSSETAESIYLHPIPDIQRDEDEGKQPLLHDTNNDEQSPYEEVAVNVANHDDPAMLCLTFRSVFVGILLTCIKAFTDQVFALRTSPLYFDAGIVILLSYMMGKFLSNILPEKVFNLTLNPGPFSVKEHTLIVMMAISGDGITNAVQALAIQRLYYHYYLNHFHALLFIIIMNLFAFSIASILKRYLIWPGSMIWPRTLMNCCLIRTLNKENDNEQNQSQWKMSRLKFFWLMVLCQFLWYWFPGYIFPLLSFFSLLCLIAPHDIIFSQITGSGGLGFGALQFDWNAWAAFLDSPIFVPFWAHVNVFIGFVMVMWIATPILYYTNVWNSQRMPIVSNRVFDVNGYYYDTSKVLDKNSRLNHTAYETYGGMRLPIGFVLVFGFVLAGFSAAIVHTILYHGKSVVEQFRSSLSEKNNDIHAKLMSHYPDIPDIWYYILFVVTLFLASLNSYNNELVSGFVVMLAMLLNIIFIIPLGIITATTGFPLSTVILSNLIGSLIYTGNPLGYLTFDTYTLGCQNKIVVFLLIFKTAHYMKIPPRISLFLLILCQFISSTVHYVTAIYLLNHIPNICTPQNILWRCLAIETGYSLSIIWSVVGVVKLVGSDSPYGTVLFGLLIGLFLPVISWYFWKKYPNISWIGFINFPLILLAAHAIPTAPALEYPSWFLVGFIFNYILYRHAHSWWEKYAYTFSAAMSCGVAICGFIITFVFQNNNIYFPHWWGTTDQCPLASANYSGALPTYREL